MGRPRKYKQADVIKAIKLSHGILSAAAENLGCSRNTIDAYRQKYPRVQAAYEEANETTLDFAESQLITNITLLKEASIFFYLKTKGKKRGYREREAVLNIDLSKLSDEQLDRLYNGESLEDIIATENPDRKGSTPQETA
jgi:hypothetical protein